MKRYLFILAAIAPFFITNCYADWKERIAEENLPKVVRLDMYGVFDLKIFGVSFGTFPVHGGCSGAYIERTGTILTAAHCVDNDADFTLSSVTATSYSGVTYDVLVATLSSVLDLALLVSSYNYIGAEFPYIRTWAGGQLKVGQDVLAIGHPLGLFWTVTTGIVSHANRWLYGNNYVQFDAVIAPGSSGGPILNKKGQIIGVASRYRGGPMGSLTGLNFMVSPLQLNNFLWGVKNKGIIIERMRRYRLGDIE